MIPLPLTPLITLVIALKDSIIWSLGPDGFDEAIDKTTQSQPVLSKRGRVSKSTFVTQFENA